MKNFQELKLLRKYLSDTNNPYNSNKLKEILLSSPYEGLLAFADTLDELTIDYSILEFSDPSLSRQESELPGEFLTSMEYGGRTISCLVKIRNSQVDIFYPNGFEEKKVPFSEFIKKWGRICIVIKPKKFKVSFSGSILCLLGLTGIGWLLFYMLGLSFETNWILIISLCLLVITGVIIVSEYFTKGTEIVEKVCKSKEVRKNQIDCSSLIRDHGTFLTSWLKITDFLIVSQVVVFITFLGTRDLVLCFYLDALALPFIGYSLVKQARLRLWCKLCLLIALFLLIRFFSCFLFLESFHLGFSAANLSVLLISGVTIFFIWGLIRWMLLVFSDKLETTIQLRTFQRDVELFNSYLMNRDDSSVGALEQGLFIRKHTDAELQNDVTFVISPFCSHCLEVVVQLKKRSIENFNVRLLLSANFDPTSPSPSQLVGSVMIGIYTRNGWDAFLEAYIELHNISNKKEWYDSNRMFQSDASNIALMKQNEFLRSNHISISPIAFFQNKMIGTPYSAVDVFHFLS